MGAAYGYGEVPPRELVSYRSAEPFLARVDDRPSTGPLGRSEKAALVSGSSSALLGRRRRGSADGLAAPRGWLAVPRGGVGVPRGGVTASRGWAVVPRGGVTASRGWLPVPGRLVALIGWLLLAATRAGCVAPGSGSFLLWTGCVAA